MIALRKDGVLNFIIGDHLGSTSLVTDANGTVVSEMRYKAWGEVRHESGASPTEYTYTGQYSYTADFGLMFYNARWYDPSLGRFAQADTIIPSTQGVQAWDRFAYTNNNPLRYIDPAGHRACTYKQAATGDETCWQNVANNFNTYSNWEQKILKKLYDRGGSSAQHGIQYILENNIHIKVKSGWQSGFGSRGAWYEGNNLIVLNRDLKNPDGSPVYSLNTMPDEWGLANIIHEAKHIEQGPELAFSKLGEMEAWQIEIDVAENLGWYVKNGWNPRDRGVKRATTVSEFSEAIRQYDKPYWRGLSLLLDYPLYYYNPCSMMVFCPNGLWWGP
jgi:RHS repeat-associated protein